MRGKVYAFTPQGCGLLGTVVGFDEVYNLANVAKSHAHNGVGSSIIDGHTLAIVERCAGENDIGHVALQLIGGVGREQIGLCAIENALGMLLIQDGSAHGIAITVARSDDTMIEQEPAFVDQEGHGSGANLRTLPGTLWERSGRHDATMLAPILHIGTETEVDVAERGVAIVTGTAQKGILAIDFFGEEHAIAVEWQEGILALIERFEVESVAKTNRRTVVTVAPSNPITVFKPRHPWVVFVFRGNHLRVARLENDGFFVDFPMDAVVAEACKDIHLHGFVVATEHTCEAVFKRNDGTIEDAVGRGDVISADDGVVAVAPHHVFAALRALLPREFLSWNFCHVQLLLCCFYFSFWVCMWIFRAASAPLLKELLHELTARFGQNALCDGGFGVQNAGGIAAIAALLVGRSINNAPHLCPA